jgi:hypothetical protein
MDTGEHPQTDDIMWVIRSIDIPKGERHHEKATIILDRSHSSREWHGYTNGY